MILSSSNRFKAACFSTSESDFHLSEFHCSSVFTLIFYRIQPEIQVGDFQNVGFSKEVFTTHFLEKLFT